MPPFVFAGQILHNKFNATFKTFTPFSPVRDHACQTQKLYPPYTQNTYIKVQYIYMNICMYIVYIKSECAFGDSVYGCGELFNCNQAGDYFGKFFRFFDFFFANSERLMLWNKNHKCLARIY